MRKLLDNLYESIKKYEVEKGKNKEEIEKITNEIDEISTSLNSSNNLNKLEKMKKQMDLSYLQSKLELIEMKKENSSNSNLRNLENEIKSKSKKIERAIYTAIRINDLKYVAPLEKLIEKYGDKPYKVTSIKNFYQNNPNLEIKENFDAETLPELSPIYEYYKKVSDVENEILEPLLKNIDEANKKIEKFKDTLTIESSKRKAIIKKLEEEIKISSEKKSVHSQKLDMLEELIDEMATEVIREDMKKNNVTLPEFVKGMRYFKSEDEENIENSEIVD